MVRAHRAMGLMVLAAALLAVQHAHAAELKPEEIVERNGKAVVLITGTQADGTPVQGTGFIISANGAILTNLHVIRGLSGVQVKLVGGTTYRDVQLVDYDPMRDYALLRVDARDLPSVTRGDSDAAKIGARVYVIGNPKGLENTISDGLLSGRREAFKEHVRLQISAPISAGSSGSPVFDSEGRVIGIAVSKVVDGENLNFAIPINEVKADPQRAARFALPAEPSLLWHEFKAADGAFSIDLPGLPEFEDTEAEPGDLFVLRHHFLVDAGDGLYTISYTQYPDKSFEASDAAAANRLLVAYRDVMATQIGAKVSSTKKIELAGFPGIEYRLRGPRGTAITGRAFLVQDRVYELVTLSGGKVGEGAGLPRFFDSFKVTATTGPAAAAAAGWKLFRSREGGFSVLLPGEPEVSAKESGTGDEQVQSRMWIVRSGTSIYGVLRLDYSPAGPGGLPADERLRVLVRSFGKGKKLSGEKAIRLGDVPGRAVHVVDGGIKGLLRFFIVEDRVYLVSATTTEDREPTEEFIKFLDSFRLDDAEPGAPLPPDAPEKPMKTKL